MLLSTAEDLARFVDELKRESDRGLALVGAALIDDKVGDTLKAFFRASMNSLSPRSATTSASIHPKISGSKSIRI